jgi:acylphosphatase
MLNKANRVRLRLTGRVQGVGFRWFVLGEARRLGVRGWVRNNGDGSVELEAAGTVAELTELRSRVAVGPPAARVDQIHELPASSETLPAPFEMTRGRA